MTGTTGIGPSAKPDRTPFFLGCIILLLHIGFSRSFGFLTSQYDHRFGLSHVTIWERASKNVSIKYIYIFWVFLRVLYTLIGSGFQRRCFFFLFSCRISDVFPSCCTYIERVNASFHLGIDLFYFLFLSFI